MKKSPIILYAAVLAAVVSLSSCGVGSDDPAAAKTTPPVVSTSKPTPSRTTTQAPTSTGPAFPKGVPVEARKHTKEGSVAFVNFFLTQLNRSWTSAEPDLIDPFCSRDSDACKNWVGTASDLKKKKQRYDRDPLTVESLSPLTPAGETLRVLVLGQQEHANVVNASGRVVLTDKQKQLSLIFAVEWTETGWIINSAGSVTR